MTNSKNPSDILNQYDFLSNEIKDNASRENLIQEVLQILLGTIGYDFTVNAQTQIFLEKPTKTPQEILASLLAQKDAREAIVIDKT
ncbi:MAG: hypothetical protein ACRCX2_22320, partial [Paraclostridium sp.]